VTAAIELRGRRPAGSIAETHPLIVAAQDARARVGLPPAALEAGSTDANAAYEHGIPAITVGVSRGGGVHRADEWIESGPIQAGALAALYLIMRLTGTATAGVA
jgi:acetylornithine deacetylase/succinyl-diaminopimelate desuccinylase-like protein